MKLQKWLLLEFLTLEKVNECSCVLSSHFRISKLVSFTYDLGAFQMILVLFKLLLLHCISGQVGLGVNFTFAQVLVVPLDLIPTDFQDQKYWGLVFGTGPRGWSAWHGAQCLHSSRESSVVWGFLPTCGKPHLGWGPWWGSLTWLMQLFHFLYWSTVCLVLKVLYGEKLFHM